ncbi:MAG: TerB family tellurite resistance protein [Gammaproteobacteria bacterium]
MISAIQKFFSERISDSESTDQQRQHALQIAASVLMIEISRSDAHVAEVEEQTILSALQKTFSLDKEESVNLMSLANDKTDQAISFHEFTREINDQFSAKEKINLVKLLWDVAIADGEIDKYEDFYIRKVSDLLYVSHSDFIRMKHKAIDEKT